MNLLENNIFLINKPPGLTSHDVVFKVRKHLNIKKVGHTGTLDKFASGLLIILTGKSTKLSDVFLNLDKKYISKIMFGQETSTLDPEGQVIATADIPSQETILTQLEQFNGEILQVPPEYSAIHVGGQRAFRLAQQSKTVELKPRKIHIYNYKVLDLKDLPHILVEWHVSKGTYIRSIARDLGRACQSRASLAALQRTQIGAISLTNALAFNDVMALNYTQIDNRTISTFSRSILSIETLLQQVDNTFRIHTTDSTIRLKMIHGTLPYSLLKNFSSTHKLNQQSILYVCDQQGLVGVWKYNNAKFELIVGM